jgi:predicted nuclease with TOPRIM domain
MILFIHKYRQTKLNVNNLLDTSKKLINYLYLLMMKKIVKLNQSDIKRIVKIVLEQDNLQNNEWVKVSPEEFLDLMKLASYSSYAVSRMPKFRDKKIWITGDLRLNGTPTNELKGITYIEGNLDISNTDISNISNITIKGRVNDYNSGVSRLRAKLERQKKEAENQERRESGEWLLTNPNIDSDGLKANALLQYLSGEYGLDIKTNDDYSRLEELEGILSNLEDKETEYDEQGMDLTDVQADIEATQDEIDEINKKLDIYDLHPLRYGHYDMSQFEVFGDYDFSGNEYAVGTESETDDSVRDYADDMAGDLDNFSSTFVESHIDADSVAEYAEQFYDDDVRENPDVYFNDDEYELTAEQEKRIEEIEKEIEELQERLENLEDEIEEPSEYSDTYDEIQEEIDMLEDEKNQIEPKVGEPTDDMINDKVSDLVYQVKRDPDDFIENLGLDKRNFIDTESLIQDLIDSDGYQLISPYDGSYDTEIIEGDLYYIIRVN